MSTTRNPPSIGNCVATCDGAGDLAFNRFVYDFAATAYAKTTTLGIGDKLLVGYIPKGSKLVPHLCRLSMPIADSNGTPLLRFTFGDDTTTTALIATPVAGAVATEYTDEDFVLTTGELGSNTADTPLYLYCTTAAATGAVVGKIVFHQVCRNWDSNFDVAA